MGWHHITQEVFLHSRDHHASLAVPCFCIVGVTRPVHEIKFSPNSLLCRPHPVNSRNSIQAQQFEHYGQHVLQHATEKDTPMFPSIAHANHLQNPAAPNATDVTQPGGHGHHHAPKNIRHIIVTTRCQLIPQAGSVQGMAPTLMKMMIVHHLIQPKHESLVRIIGTLRGQSSSERAARTFPFLVVLVPTLVAQIRFPGSEDIQLSWQILAHVVQYLTQEPEGRVAWSHGAAQRAGEPHCALAGWTGESRPTFTSE